MIEEIPNTIPRGFVFRFEWRTANLVFLSGLSLFLDAHEIVVQGSETAVKRPKIWVYTNGVFGPENRSLKSQIFVTSGAVDGPNQK